MTVMKGVSLWICTDMVTASFRTITTCRGKEWGKLR